MGILHLPDKKYKCSKCESTNCQEYKERSAGKYVGYYYGVRCQDCGHKTRHYKKSTQEEEMGGGKVYRSSDKEELF